MIKYLVIPVLGALALTGCASYQAKVVDVREKIECSINVLLPYVDYLTSEQLEEALLGADVVDVLAYKGVVEQEIKDTKAALKACHEKK